MKKWIFAVALLVGTVVRAQDTGGNFVDAVALYNSGEYRRASHILETLAKVTPGDDAVWYYLGMSEAGMKQPDAALEHLKKASELDPHNYWYKQRLAALYRIKGEDEKVVALYESILQDFPDKTDVSYDLLDLYLRRGEYEKALNALGDVEALTGPSEQTARMRYDIYRQLGRMEDAFRTLEDFTAEYASPTILSMLGDYYLEEYQDSLAQASYLEALEADSGYIPALLGLSEVYRQQRHYPEYFSTIGRFVRDADVPAASKSMYIMNLVQRLDPKILSLHRSEFDAVVQDAVACHDADSTMLSAAGTYYYSTGRTAPAGTFFRKAADLYPESIAQTATFIQYLGMQEQWEEVRDRSVAAFNRFREIAFLDYANSANYNLGDYDAIIGNCQYVITASGSDKDLRKNAYAMMGDAQHAKGDDKAAFRSYERALKLDPDYALVLNNYAYYLSLQGTKLKKAYAMARKAVEAEPDNATYLDTFGWILHLQGKDLEAKPFFKHAMLYGGKESAVILGHYATVLEALGENDLARSYRNQAASKPE